MTLRRSYDSATFHKNLRSISICQRSKKDISHNIHTAYNVNKLVVGNLQTKKVDSEKL